MSALKALLSSRPVAYYPELARAVGGIAPALFFQQIAHWQGGDESRWVFRTQEELEEELAMSPKVQATCRKHLVDGGFIEEERRAKNRLHYRPVWEKVEAALQTIPSGNSRPAQPESLDLPNRRNSLNKSKNESITPTGETASPASTKSWDTYSTGEKQKHLIAYLHQRLDERGLDTPTPGYKQRLSGELRTFINRERSKADLLFALDHIVARWRDKKLELWQAVDDMDRREQGRHLRLVREGSLEPTVTYDRLGRKVVNGYVVAE
jgi:hypothetical protein